MITRSLRTVCELFLRNASSSVLLAFLIFLSYFFNSSKSIVRESWSNILVVREREREEKKKEKEYLR
ncbi:hypothetical protein BpHYR1_022095 [Brachionus plicatilis]|uniref:Uncharacterized protein n=1 Tax=Brachionus plicatilis TaxID=10195 RepID=A0A3M7SVD9_BRAPC|nr:hypothetical protein BpHYR1_022095 [Brachionus plicatilis]